MSRRKTTRALSPCSFYQHGWKLFQHGDLEGARDTLLRSVDVDFDNAAAWGLLARVYEAMDEPQHAAEAARQAIRSAPNDPHWCVVAATMLMPLGLYDEARLKIDRALELNPEHADAYFNRAIVNASQNKAAAAIADLKKAL
ncbi:MAG: tetratricopeptide repeat protein, partial [Planctomycetes bacterium]|nr:tetratricopeptide repeat protein [Planctomycetota bacterium]